MFAWYGRMCPRPRFPPIYTPPTSRSDTRNSSTRSLAHCPQHSRPRPPTHHTQPAPPRPRTLQHRHFQKIHLPSVSPPRAPQKTKNLHNCIRPPTNPNRDLAAPPQQPSPKLPPQSPRSLRPPLLRAPHSHPARFQTLRQPPAAATARSFSTRYLDN